MWKSRHSSSSDAPAASKAPAGSASSRPAETKGKVVERLPPVRVNRAQLLIGGAIALVLAGTTAFVFLQEAIPDVPIPPPAAPEPAPPKPLAAAPLPAPAIQPVAPVETAPAIALPAAEARPAPVTPPEAAPPAAPPPAAPPPQAGSSAPPPVGAYTLQLGAFLVPGNAAALVDRVTRHGGQAEEKVETDASGRTWHTVRSGAYATPAEARAAADALKRSDDIDALVVATARDRP